MRLCTTEEGTEARPHVHGARADAQHAALVAAQGRPQQRVVLQVPDTAHQPQALQCEVQLHDAGQ